VVRIASTPPSPAARQRRAMGDVSPKLRRSEGGPNHKYDPIEVVFVLYNIEVYILCIFFKATLMEETITDQLVKIVRSVYASTIPGSHNIQKNLYYGLSFGMRLSQQKQERSILNNI